jgi:hypothetical protein
VSLEENACSEKCGKDKLKDQKDANLAVKWQNPKGIVSENVRTVPQQMGTCSIWLSQYETKKELKRKLDHVFGYWFVSDATNINKLLFLSTTSSSLASTVRRVPLTIST